MGLFSSKKTINVSSTLYNMAGDEDDRPDFLKGVLFGSVLADSPSLADEITGSYFEGPGQDMLQFFRYCDQINYSILPTASVVNSLELDPADVSAEVPPSAPAGYDLSVYQASVNNGDFEPWIEKWILENHPDRVSEDWLGEYDAATEVFSVEFPNTDLFSFDNDGSEVPLYDPLERYIVAKFIEFKDLSDGVLTTGTPSTGVTSLPDVSSFTLDSEVVSSTATTLTRSRTTVYSFDNGDPDILHEDAVSADVGASLDNGSQEYIRDIVVSQNGVSMEGERQWWYFTETDSVVGGYSDVVVTTTDMGGGVTRTETATTTGEQVQKSWTTQYDTQELFIGEQFGPEQIYIYQVGSGNLVLDALVDDSDTSSFQEFYPFVPVRIDNVSISDASYSSLYVENETVYRKAFPGKRFEELVDIVEDNDDIDDIDYSYLCWGASLNAKDNSAKLYTYDFLSKLIPFQKSGSSTAMSDFETRLATYESELAAFELWQSTHADENQANFEWDEIPTRPDIPLLVLPPTNTIRLRIDSIGFDYRLNWIHIEEEDFVGVFDVEVATPAKVKDCKMEVGTPINWNERTNYNTLPPELQTAAVVNEITTMKIYRQTEENAYKVLTVWGLVSENYIYGGKAVVINSTEALEDTDESGFLIPLHYPTMLEMNIVDYTQLCTSNVHIMFNSYSVVTQKWYESALFKILLVIAIIIIAVVVNPGAFASGAGILGGNLAVGTAIGLTGTAALVAGVVANYIASIVIAEVLKILGTEIFGEKWGALFAALAGFALGAAISGTSLFSAEGLLGLGNSLANGYAGFVEGNIAEISEKLESEGESYEERMEYIEDLMRDLEGTNDLNFNPMFLTQPTSGNSGSSGYVMETAEQFIRRTTMTGSDIVELTHAMVFDYTTIANTLPRNV